MKKIHHLTVKDGSCLYYETMGKGQPLILLHGNGGSSHFFASQVKTLKKYYHLIVVDCRGRGHSSDCSHHITYDLMVEDLEAIIRHENLGKVNVLGFSDGANLALCYAQKYPHRIHSLILNAANRRFSDLTKEAQERFRTFSFVTKKLGQFIPEMRRRHHYFQLAFAEIPLQEKVLQSLNVPVLIMVGENDIVDIEFSRKLCSLFPNALLLVEPLVGHMFARQKPTQYTNYIINFLENKAFQHRDVK